MRVLEKNFWQSLKRRLDKHKKKIHYERVENRANTGTPDVLICYLGWYCLIELKVAPNKISSQQRNWHKAHQKAKGNVFTMTLRPNDKEVVLTDKGETELFKMSWTRVCVLELLEKLKENNNGTQTHNR